jgi:muramoyltetrapeptide carboxypeptidase
MTIGVVAPSSPVSVRKLEKGIQLLEARGYMVERGVHLYDRHAYLAGTDEGRAADLQQMLVREDIDAVFCARGGFGACRIVELIDWDLIAKSRPKPFAGFSDLTTIHLAIERRLGWTSFHSPVLTTMGEGISPVAEECFWNLLERSEPLGLMDSPPQNMTTIVPGVAQGALAGGCLSMLCASIGTWEQPNFAGKIVALEDTNEPLYRVDRYVNQLIRSGLLDDCVGIVLGTVTGWEKDLKEPISRTLDDVWREYFVPLGKPVISGFPFGHEPDPLTLPFGCLVELDAMERKLTILETAVS